MVNTGPTQDPVGNRGSRPRSDPSQDGDDLSLSSAASGATANSNASRRSTASPPLRRRRLGPPCCSCWRSSTCSTAPQSHCECRAAGRICTRCGPNRNCRNRDPDGIVPPPTTRTADGTIICPDASNPQRPAAEVTIPTTTRRQSPRLNQTETPVDAGPAEPAPAMDPTDPAPPDPEESTQQTMPDPPEEEDIASASARSKEEDDGTLADER